MYYNLLLILLKNTDIRFFSIKLIFMIVCMLYELILILLEIFL